MESYTLKLTGSYNYRLYKNGTLVSDSDLATLFATAGEAYFVINFSSQIPTYTNRLRIQNSQSQSVMYNSSGLDILDDREYKGTWANNASSFTSFTQVEGRTITEEQLSFLMHQIKNGSGGGGVTTLTSADYNWNAENQTTENPDCIAFWLLDEGYYATDGTINTAWYTWSDTPEEFAGNILVTPTNNFNEKNIVIQSAGADTILAAIWTETSPGEWGTPTWSNLVTENRLQNFMGSIRRLEYGQVPTTDSSGEPGQVWIDVEQNGLSSIARQFIFCEGVYDEQTGTTTNVWQEIGSGFGTLTATPTSSTFGVEGRLYRYDTTGTGTYEIWLCLADDGNGTYTWKQVNLT